MSATTRKDARQLGENLPYLNRYALYLTRNEADADDLVGETLLKTMEYLCVGDTYIEKVKPWMRKVMYRAFIDSFRRKRTSCEFQDWMTIEPPQQGGAILARKVMSVFKSQDLWDARIMKLHISGLSASKISKKLSGYKSSKSAVLSCIDRETHKIKQAIAG